MLLAHVCTRTLGTKWQQEPGSGADWHCSPTQKPTMNVSTPRRERKKSTLQKPESSAAFRFHPTTWERALHVLQYGERHTEQSLLRLELASSLVFPPSWNGNEMLVTSPVNCYQYMTILGAFFCQLLQLCWFCRSSHQRFAQVNPGSSLVLR